MIRDTRPRRYGIAKDDAGKLCGNAVRRRSAVAEGRQCEDRGVFNRTRVRQFLRE